MSMPSASSVSHYLCKALNAHACEVGKAGRVLVSLAADQRHSRVVWPPACCTCLTCAVCCAVLCAALCCATVCEVFCGKQAWHGLHYGVVVERVVIQGERPVIPEDMPEELVLLMRRCWDADPTKRPSFEQVGPGQLAGWVGGLGLLTDWVCVSACPCG